MFEGDLAMNEIALVTSKSAGGVKHITDKLQRGWKGRAFPLNALYFMEKISSRLHGMTSKMSMLCTISL
jgi:hypothetical protein